MTAETARPFDPLHAKREQLKRDMGAVHAAMNIISDHVKASGPNEPFVRRGAQPVIDGLYYATPEREP